MTEEKDFKASDLTLSIEDFSDRHIQPAIEELARRNAAAEPSFYTCTDDCPRLTSTEIHDAIENHLDGIPRDEWPETLRVYGWKRLKIETSGWTEQTVVDIVIEHLDEEYGDPDGDTTDTTEPMLAAARVFVAAIVAEYQKTSWPHEVDEDFQLYIHVKQWVEQYALEWLV